MKGKGLSPGLELLSDSSKADCTLKAGVFPGPKQYIQYSIFQYLYILWKQTSRCSELDDGVTDGGGEVEESKHSFGTKQLARKFS